MGTLKTDHIRIPGSPSLAHHRLQTGNRSPLESPPAAKKPLKTGSKVEFVTAPSQKPVHAGKENRSILKPQRLAAILSGANELGGASVGGARTRSWPGSLRRVNFEHNVEVVVYDPVDGDYVCSESQQLVTEPRDRKLFIGRTLLGRGVRGSVAMSSVGQRQQLDRLHPAQSQTYSRTEPPTIHRPLPPGPSSVSNSPSGTFDRHPLHSEQPQQQELDFTFYEDHSGQLRLKFTVPLGPGVAAGDALVKANVAGNKIRVLGTRTVAEAGTPLCRRYEFSWRYSLPMDVDPYAITARMDTSGNLFVEAPVKTTDRRRTVGTVEQLGKIAAV